MPEFNEDKHEEKEAADQLTAQKNSVPNGPQTENPAPIFPPEGFMKGHIYVRARVNPDRFTILGSNGHFYTYLGKPNEGEHLNRLAPITFRPSLSHFEHATVNESPSHRIEAPTCERVFVITCQVLANEQQKEKVLRRDGEKVIGSSLVFSMKEGKQPKKQSNVNAAVRLVRALTLLP